MQPVIEKIERNTNQSFAIRKFTDPCPQGIFHYHEELEIAYVINAKGKRFISGVLEEFDAGDLVLIGKNTPHYYQIDENSINYDILVIHFKEDFMGLNLKEIPELNSFYKLCKKATRGIQFKGARLEALQHLMLKIYNLPSEKRLTALIELFNLLLETEEYRIIGVSINEEHSDSNNLLRINSVYSFVSNNYSNKINLKDIARVINMTESSFCKFFKKITRKTFFNYLNEFRINKASKELLISEKNIALIAEECGYPNIANFNYQFKRVMKCSPSAYRNKFLKP
ncbi:AraC family transcriptional regulator [Flammeovirga sp. SJP92]|uniref:AraC family transcriptional regulator n=1 Tax=Flammeovirga sp. SJP92 TaxID=1775430 RepID=UPI000786FF87|nr:AraC family transcriptional regulator [Flammeovirga sp. SJP92]KXX66741.1 hypothetical protein AVL50_30795 [Flammeovirga sp. SJP92]